MKQNNIEIEWKFDKLKTMEFHYLNIKICLDVPLLNPFMRKKLNPLQINLVCCKDVPYKTDPQYKPIYALVKFVDGREFRTQEIP